MLCDMHTHSSYSPDADRNTSIAEMVTRADELGLGYIAVTDHCDCNFWYGAGEFDYPVYQQQDSMMFGAGEYAAASIKEAAELKERFPKLLCGVELGQPLQFEKAAAEITAHSKLDFVIGSLHMNSGKPDFYWIDYKAMSLNEIRRLLADYCKELLEMSISADFDVLGHLTYPLRYIVGEHGIEMRCDDLDETVRAVFSNLIDRGIGIEINTSGLRQKYGRTFPELKYVKLYRQLGGEIITLGSDAHRLSDIGAGLSVGAELAKEAGFKYTAVFKKRKPEFIAL